MQVTSSVSVFLLASVAVDAMLVAIYSGHASLDTQLFPLLCLVASASVRIVMQRANLDASTPDVDVWLSTSEIAVSGCSLLVLSLCPRCDWALSLFALAVSMGPSLQLASVLV